MRHRTRFSVSFETALRLFIPFHVLNLLVTNRRCTWFASEVKAPPTSHFEAEIKAEEMVYRCTQKLHDAWKQAHQNLFWNVDTLQQPKENDGLGCTYKFKEAGKPIGREARNLRFYLGF